MFKKLTIGVAGIVVIGGLLFGGKLIPYAKTAVTKVRTAAQDQVPVAYQLDAAKIQLDEIGRCHRQWRAIVERDFVALLFLEPFL